MSAQDTTPGHSASSADLEAAQAQVGDAEHLRLRVAVVVGLEQNGGVAALDEAVVEEQTDEAGFDAGVGGAHGVPHDGFRAGALVVVVSDAQSRVPDPAAGGGGLAGVGGGG